MKRPDGKSDCPINHFLETFGDSWSLLIVRDIVFAGKSTFGEFLESDERISTSALSSRLASLQEKGVLLRRPHPRDRRKEVYQLTEKGLDVVPVLLELGEWGAKHRRVINVPRRWFEIVRRARQRVIQEIREGLAEGRAVFSGTDSTYSRLESR